MHYKFIALIANYEEVTITSFADLVRKISVLNYRSNMLSIQSKIPKRKKGGGALQPVLPLIPEKIEITEELKSKLITFELKTKEGQGDGEMKYKKSVRMFDEGSVEQWIDLLRDLKEIWKQNSIKTGSDQVSTVRALVPGESLTAFESAIQDVRMNEEGEEQEITTEHIQIALNAVSTTVFPHRALEIQKLWMNRRMFKPAVLMTRQTAAAIIKLNNSLPLFPGGSESSKFAEN